MASARYVDTLRLLVEAGVEFVVVGMAAGILQGVPATTLDLDIVHRRTPANVERLLSFRSFVLSAMSERIFELMCTLEQLATSTMEQRVAAYLAARVANKTEIATTQTMIASELGTAREVVFRALRALAGRGLIVTTRGRVRVVDYDGLADAGVARTKDKSE